MLATVCRTLADWIRRRIGYRPLLGLGIVIGSCVPQVCFAQNCFYAHDVVLDGLNPHNDPKLSYRVNGGVCQQCQKGEWVDVDPRNCPECSGNKNGHTSRVKPAKHSRGLKPCKDSTGDYSPWAWRYDSASDKCERCEDGAFIERATQCNTCKMKDKGEQRSPT